MLCRTNKEIVNKIPNKVKNNKLKGKTYLKLTDACQTKARSKKRTGIIGNTSTIGSKGAYASGNFANKKAINYKFIFYEV